MHIKRTQLAGVVLSPIFPDTFSGLDENRKGLNIALSRRLTIKLSQKALVTEQKRTDRNSQRGSLYCPEYLGR